MAVWLCGASLLPVLGLLFPGATSAQQPALVFSAGFSSDAVLQRGERPVSVYGFVSAGSGWTSPSVSVSVLGTDGGGKAVFYTVPAATWLWEGDAYMYGSPAPPHGDWVWRAQLKPSEAGGEYAITATDGANGTATIERITFGDVWFCSGQSNMALATYFTFSSETLRQEILSGRYNGGKLRHFMFAGMNSNFEATQPMWVTTKSTESTNPYNGWFNTTTSAAMPLRDKRKGNSPYAEFGATCMYFGAELMDSMRSQGLEEVPIGLIQASLGGSQIEAWMSNETLLECRNESLTGGSAGNNSGDLFYGLVAPFTNYSVRGWLWYQGENNCYGDMGNVIDGEGYGCELAAMVKQWRAVWDAPADSLFGIVTLAAGTSEGHGSHMAGMRWSQAGNYGVWPNPAIPYSFGAQAYDLGDPWANVGDGNPREEDEPTQLRCSFLPRAPRPCPDKLNCSNPDPVTGHYGEDCSVWDKTLWTPAMQPFSELVRANSPSGLPANNFMGPIHPRLKRPVGRRLAIAAARAMSKVKGTGAITGPTISGCDLSIGGGQLEISFNEQLLGGEGLLLGPFNANKSTWAPKPGEGGPAAFDSLGLMVCTVDASKPDLGNETTCQCQGWNVIQLPDQSTFWYCEVGPGYKPLREVVARQVAERLRKQQESGWAFSPANLSWVPSPNPFRDQWQPAPLKPGSSPNSVSVDLSGLAGRTPLAVRLAWPLFDSFGSPGDTCCPGADVLSGRAPCVPGNCPLYSGRSELPANPFFARIIDGNCKCREPQKCDEKRGIDTFIEAFV